MADSVQVGGRHNSPLKVQWFEFLLNNTLLEKHLQTENCDPSPAELIVTFLYQSEVATSLLKDTGKTSVENNVDDRLSNQNEVSGENKKVIALKLLALKTAAFLKWNLDILNNDVPLAMIYSLLTELLKLTDSPSPLEPWRHNDLDLTTLSGHSLFAIRLYHSWCLGTVVSDSLPSKPVKPTAIPVPGQADPNVLLQNRKDAILKQLREGVELSARVLERLMWRQALLPTFHCFGFVNADTRILQHQWGKGIMINSDEFTSQVAYDLGSYYFYKQDCTKAWDMFQIAADLIKKLNGSRLLCNINEARLIGYANACTGVLHVSPTLERSSIFERLMDMLRTCKFENLTDVLREESREQSLIVELLNWLCKQIISKTNNPNAVSWCHHISCVRSIANGHIMDPHYVNFLQSDPTVNIPICLQVCQETLASSKCTHLMQQNIKHWLRYLCAALPGSTRFKDQLKSRVLCQLFNSDEAADMFSEQKDEQYDQLMILLPQPLSDDDVILQKLAIASDPNEIRELTNKLSAKQNKQQLTMLSDRVKLPKDVQNSLEALPVLKAQVYVHMLVIKSRLCVEMKNYEKARILLQAADSTVRDISYKLSKMLRWELLRLELLQQQALGTLPRDITQQELTKRVLSYITALQSEQDLKPNIELLEYCSSYLLSMKEYDHLINCNSRDIGGCVRLAQLLAAVCKDITNIKETREAARDLWHAVSLIFTSSPVPSAPKRPTPSGRDVMLTSRTFTDFVKKLNEPTALSLLVSCLTKLFAILKSNITSDIYSDYNILWPNSIGNSSSLNTDNVSETLHTVISHAMKTSAAHLSWLHTKADLCFAEGQYADALHYYLQLGMSISDYYSDLAALQPVFTDDMIKKLIKCCLQLSCHTQVAVLCQMLEEVDYATAFKALQESSTTDAMDAYYDYLWDIAILEFLTYWHTKRGEFQKRSHVLRIIGQLELNASNPQDILTEAIKIRKSAFLRTMAKLYSVN